MNSFTGFFQGFFLDFTAFKHCFKPPHPIPLYWLKPSPPYKILKSPTHVLNTCGKPYKKLRKFFGSRVLFNASNFSPVVVNLPEATFRGIWFKITRDKSTLPIWSPPNVSLKKVNIIVGNGFYFATDSWP